MAASPRPFRRPKEPLIVPSHRHIRPALFLAAVLALVVFVAPSYGALTAPSLTGPANGVTVDSPPVFTWGAVSGADHYVFQLGGSTGFNPPQFSVSTKNTRVVLTTSIANADYTWRVAAVSATGVQGAWSVTRSFTEDWQAYTPHPPYIYGNIGLEAGGNLLMELTDVEPGELEVGAAVRFVFRVKDFDSQRAYRRYVWKATGA